MFNASKEWSSINDLMKRYERLMDDANRLSKNDPVQEKSARDSATLIKLRIDHLSNKVYKAG